MLKISDPDQWKNAHINSDPADRISTSLLSTLGLIMFQ